MSVRLAPLALLSCIVCSSAAFADEGGVGFWLPGQFGSLAAVPQNPGWSIGTVYYHTSLKAGGDVAAAREVTIGRLNRNLTVDLNVNLQARPDLEFLSAFYTFKTPVLGGQFTAGMATAFGKSSAGLDGTLTASLGNLTATRSGSIGDARWGVADLYPQVSLRWNAGVHNYMVYGMGDIPTGTYDSSRLANVGIGHGAADGGVGYTYFNPATGYEFSAVTGLTYNFKNYDTGYRNGVDWHLDWGASKFLTKQLFVGAVGYVYQQLTADSGAAAFLGDNKSGVAAVGPQFGYIFPVGTGLQGYLNLKAYFEFEARNRPEGFNTWLIFAISQAAEAPPPSARMMHK